MNLPDYYNFQKYMRERGAADLINPQNQIPVKDGGSDSKGIGEIILPPIAGGNQGDEGGGIPTLRKSYTVGPTADKSQAVNVDGTTMLDVPSTQVLGTGIIPAYGKYPTEYTLGNVYTGEFDDSDEGTVFDSTEPKQNLLQKGIGSIKDFFGKFSSPKVQGTLGTRLSNRINNPGFQLPLQGIFSGFAKKLSPFNPDAKNYNPILEQQLNIAEAGDKVGYDEKSGLLKYSENSVLRGQNAISGFGTNDYEEQLNDYLKKVQGVFNKKYGDLDLTDINTAEKEKALRYKKKYIIATLEELKPFKNKKYIEKKKQLKEQREAKKIKDELAAAAKAKAELAAAAKAKADKIKETYQLQQQQIKDSGGYAEDGGSGPRRGDADISDRDRGGFATDDTAGFFARGGRVRRSYFDGGIVTL